MEDQHIGWVAAIIVGGIAGWLAEVVTKSNTGILVNIVLGIIGAGLGAWILRLLGLQVQGGWISYLISGFIGACILIAVTRLWRPNQWRS